MEVCRKRKEKGESGFFLMLCFICFFNLEHVSSWYPYLTGGGGGGGLQRRRRVLKRGGVGMGGIFHPAIRIPLLKFSKMPLSCSLAEANLFAIITASSVSVIDL